ncbi:hypothetical protein BC936DRAFT_143093 [Jimgerdemannia flammicorona]|uniref:Uncharacterized protein n=1 Tax=Jimgerdemannia flammicorona TaxID=994334 RepID=A0A433DEF7_9FUNG|nr:hypothetical protein BC936DRAFT_143093 [Jimgerdemannia flammicorona]
MPIETGAHSAYTGAQYRILCHDTLRIPFKNLSNLSRGSSADSQTTVQGARYVKGRRFSHITEQRGVILDGILLMQLDLLIMCHDRVHDIQVPICPIHVVKSALCRTGVIITHIMMLRWGPVNDRFRPINGNTVRVILHRDHMVDRTIKCHTLGGWNFINCFTFYPVYDRRRRCDGDNLGIVLFLTAAIIPMSLQREYILQLNFFLPRKINLGSRRAGRGFSAWNVSAFGFRGNLDERGWNSLVGGWFIIIRYNEEIHRYTTRKPEWISSHFNNTSPRQSWFIILALWPHGTIACHPLHATRNPSPVRAHFSSLDSATNSR